MAISSPLDDKVGIDRAHFDYLIAVRGTAPGLTDQERWGVKYLYDRLGILDNKTSALLRFNGVAMGFLAVLVSRILEKPELFAIPRGLVLFAAFALLLFGFAEMRAFQIFWLRFDRIGGDRTFEIYKDAFFTVTCRREEYYRQAFAASGAAAFMFFLGILWMIVPFVIVVGPYAPK